MRLIVVLSFVIAACSAGVLKDSTEGFLDSQSRYFMFPGDGDDELHLVDAEEPVEEMFLSEFTRNPANNAYWLYTRSNPTTSQILILNDADSVLQSNFDSGKTTVFVVHGWKGDGNNDMNIALREAFLEDGDVNVIVLDWNRLAGRSYTTARAGVPQIGQGLGQFINFLTTLGLDLNNTHLVGFSLGGHIVGHAGRENGGLIKRITALDPAGPLFSNKNRILETDGQFVEIIHTSTSFLGYKDPIGHSDHYPNGGSGMPNCWLSSCSHGMAWEYMASTVKNNHLFANECETLRQATRNKCTGEVEPMGTSDLNKTRPGIFRVNTAKKYPY